MLRYRRYRAFLVFVVFTIFGLYYTLAGDRTWQSATLGQPALGRLGLNSKPGEAAAPGEALLPDLGGERTPESATPQSPPVKAVGQAQEEDVEELPRKYDAENKVDAQKKQSAKEAASSLNKASPDLSKDKSAASDGSSAAKDGSSSPPSVKDTSAGSVKDTELSKDTSAAPPKGKDSTSDLSVAAGVKEPANALASAVKSASSTAAQASEAELASSAQSSTKAPLSSASLSPPKPSGTVQWSKQPEHFPVTATIPIPTGAAKKIPTIQFKFPSEDAASKKDRLEKLAKIKRVANKNWQSYKKFAWMHDELKPESASYNDPFGGWAATLVDALDTLFVMGFNDEFDEAVKAVEQIDFTRSMRDDIPLFETVIRYLGGMLGAYDVSGAKYPVLLTKAVELAEVLMGAFDTPNRMPITMYHWKPAFASQPHRAGSNIVMAELGTLSLEFTRLAQLTGEAKYYDAIARITDAFEEWQTRSVDPSKLPGLFPIHVDASGCMKPDLFSSGPGGSSQEVVANAGMGLAIKAPPQQAGGPDGILPDRARPVVPKTRTGSKNPNPLLSSEETSDPSQAGSAAKGIDSASELPASKEGTSQSSSDSSKVAKSKRQVSTEASTTKAKGGNKAPEEEDTVKISAAAFKEKSRANTIITEQLVGDKSDADVEPVTSKGTGAVGVTTSPSTLSYLSDEIEICAPTNLTSGNRAGRDKFTMGGLADSTYEYFPKEYLLLGGLEDKYREMHERAVDAATKNLIFRPMTPGNEDILISGDYDAWLGPDENGTPNVLHGKLSPNSQHLTCFVGGMYALGAKIFERAEDLEIATKLTEGCVYAYSITPLGIMPEMFSFMACDSKTSCKWDEEKYAANLDPDGLNRAQRYQAQLDAYEAKVRAAEAGSLVPAYSPPRDAAPRDALRSTDNTASLSKRATPAVEAGDVPIASASGASSSGPQESLAAAPAVKSANPAGDALKREGRVEPPTEPQTHAPPVIAQPFADMTRPQPPPTHEEVVEKTIKQRGLTGGLTSMSHPKYILRPEAIESVWYMYRITGDKHWREVGWTMFNAINEATMREHGNTAIADVTGRYDEELDSQESFWLAETLKYFFLLFSEEDVISLDDYVLNTEAHPFRRPTPGKKLY